jgi:hypothetical protein
MDVTELKMGIRAAIIVMGIIVFLMWSWIELEDCDLDRLSFKIWIAIVTFMTASAILWVWS